MTSPPTSPEGPVRNWLLNLLHSQWHSLGVPFSVDQSARPEEPIDPEALLWCSLEFFPTCPRLREQALAWWGENDQLLLLPRIRKFARAKGDPRTAIWCVLDPKRGEARSEPCAPCYGQCSGEDLHQFCHDLSEQQRYRERQEHQDSSPWQDRRHQRPGKAAAVTANVILRARDLLGSDARHFILVYLLSNPGGARLRSVSAWSGQSYRNISRVAQRWEAADVLRVAHGFASLKRPGLWRSLLQLDPPHVVLVNWKRFYDACVRLLRSLSKARAKSMVPSGPVVTGLVREAIDEAKGSVEAEPSRDCRTVREFVHLLSGRQ